MMLIKDLYLINGYGPRRLISQFPGKVWKKSGLCKLLARLRKTCNQRTHGNDRKRTVRSEWRDQHKTCMVANGEHS